MRTQTSERDSGLKPSRLNRVTSVHLPQAKRQLLPVTDSTLVGLEPNDNKL